jgi:hypothetical protein
VTHADSKPRSSEFSYHCSFDDTSLHLKIVNLGICSSISPSTHPAIQPPNPSTYATICSCIYLFIYPATHLSSYPPSHLTTHPIFPSTHSPIHPSIQLPTHPFIYLSTHTYTHTYIHTFTIHPSFFFLFLLPSLPFIHMRLEVFIW